MKFTIKRSIFIKKLNDVQRAISSKTTIPILSGLKMVASGEGLTLTGSDSDISIEANIAADVPENELTIEATGAIVLTAHFFSDIVKRLPEEMMTIESNDAFQATITSGSSEFKINGLDASTYPRLPEIETQNQMVLNAEVLKQIISQTVIAVSNQETRPILTGVHFIIENNTLTAVATDSHRLAQRKLNMDLPSDTHYNIIIPGKSLTELSRTLDDTIDAVEMRVADNQALFIVGDLSFYSRLLEGNYPETDRLIPTSSETTVEFDAAHLLAAIQRASLLSHAGKNNVVRLVLNTDDNSVILYGNSPEIGNVEEVLEFNELKGQSLEISFNPDYMKDALQSFGQTTIQIDFTSPLRPFTLVPSEDHEHFIQLITPVRTY